MLLNSIDTPAAPVQQAQDNRKTTIEAAHMRHLTSRYRAMPKMLLRKIGEKDVKEFSNRILSQVTSCYRRSDSSDSRRYSEDFVAGASTRLSVDEGEEHQGDRNNGLNPGLPVTSVHLHS